MGRPTIQNKNKNISISLLPNQIMFLNTHKNFNLSKFVQIHLEQMMNVYEEIESYKEDKNEKTID